VRRLELGLEAFRQVAVVLALVPAFEPVTHLRQPALEGRVLLFVLLVGPVGHHAELGMLVHVPGADLRLEGLIFGSDHGRVQRLVQVALGGGDVIVELPGDVLPEPVHDSQGGITGGDVPHQDAYRPQVEDLLQVQIFVLHLAPDTVDVLGPAADVGVDAGLGKPLPQGGDYRGDERFAFRAPAIELPGNALVRLGLEVAHGQVLDLPFDLPHPEPVGQRRIDAPGVLRDPAPAIFVQTLDAAHQVQSCGQNHQHDPDVLGDAEQQATQILFMLLPVLDSDHRVHIGKLIDAVEVCHHARDTGAETGRQPLLATLRVPETAVEQSGGQGIGIQAQLYQDVRGAEQVTDLNLAGIQLPVAAATHQQLAGPSETLTVLAGVALGEGIEPVPRGRGGVTRVSGEGVDGFDHGWSDYDCKSQRQTA